MQAIESIEALEAQYGKVSPLALSKVCDHITGLYQRWIEASRFMILSTVGPGGTDASPRGDSEEVVRIVDAKTLWLPDWKGNNRLDSLKNIVEDGRLSWCSWCPAQTPWCGLTARPLSRQTMTSPAHLSVTVICPAR